MNSLDGRRGAPDSLRMASAARWLGAERPSHQVINWFTGQLPSNKKLGKAVKYNMKQIPRKIGALYEDHLNNKAIPKRDQFDSRKWLRYYLDFCFKYKYDNLNNNNYRFFIEKLKEKGKNEQQQKQAFHAVSLYYELGLADGHKDGLLKDKNQEFSIKKEKLKETGANWVPAYDTLKAEISLRHYSPKTLRSYRGWVRRFQDYTKSKDTSLLTSVDSHGGTLFSNLVQGLQ